MASPSEPHRVQQRRTAGWRKPENTVSVARPTKWGNPFRVGQTSYFWAAEGGFIPLKVRTAESAVAMFRAWMSRPGQVSYYVGVGKPPMVGELVGKNLMCFCPLDQPCHADVLLELANGGES